MAVLRHEQVFKNLMQFNAINVCSIYKNGLMGWDLDFVTYK
jgi:hypothetical protein